MKLVSWNVNGLRACVRKGFIGLFPKYDADFSVQETKLQEGKFPLIWTAIINIGIMPNEKDIGHRPFLQKRSRLRSNMASAGNRGK